MALLAGLGLAYQFNAQAAEVVKMDRIVAIVDQAVVTEQELESRIATVTAQFKKQGTELPAEAILRKQILERLITDTLQLQYAAQTGLKVDDNQLDKTIGRIAEQNQLSLAEFAEALAKDGVSMTKFRADIRNEITLARLREREVGGVGVRRDPVAHRVGAERDPGADGQLGQERRAAHNRRTAVDRGDRAGQVEGEIGRAHV